MLFSDTTNIKTVRISYATGNVYFTLNLNLLIVYFMIIMTII